jgi:alkylation response protein AidB-like acyl-CoA dehydrogenase
VKHVLLAVVRFAFTDEQVGLRRSVRKVVELHGGVGAARRAMQSELGHDGALWSRLAGDLGLAGLVIPERLGGAGLGWVEVAAVNEELGAALAPVPFFSTVCLATSVLVACPGADAALAAIARGETAALVVGRGSRHVVDGHTADLLVVATDDGVFVVRGDAPGVRRRRIATVDPTRTVAEVQLDAAAPLERVGDRADLDLARVALAAEQVGGAQRCLDLAVEYAKVRQQFGRPIGSFQAIQHTCADMFVLVESARSAAYHAAWTADHDPENLGAAAATAAAYCGDAFYRCAGDAIQVHGGIGFTWEHDAHLYWKRARADRALLGAPAAQRERIAAMILGGA